MDALFELADVWTHTTDAKEYAEFLEKLLLAITSKQGYFLDVKGLKDRRPGCTRGAIRARCAFRINAP